MEQTTTCKCGEVSEEEKLRMIDSFIDEYKDKEGSLIQILHIAQGIYGYLPIELLKHISQKTDKPLSEISGVVSFYSFFTTQPKGKYTIKVCLGTACYVRGGKKILDRLKEILKIDVGQTTEDKLYSLEVMRCIGACGLAPAIMINEKVYKQVNPDKLRDILNNLDQEKI